MEDALESIIDYRGKTPQKSDEGIMTLSAKSVRDGYIDYSQCYFISREEYSRFMVRGFPKVGDVLLTTEAPLGVTARLDRNDVALAQRLLTLRGKSDVLDTGYLYCYLRSPIGQAKLKARQTGTTVTGIKQAEFRKIEIDLPPIDIQRKVAGVFETIDKKISVNKEINKNLEQQLHSIFVNHFADHIASATTDDCPMLQDMITIVDNRGKTPPLTTNIIDYPIIDVGALKGSGRIVDFNNCTKYVDQATYSTWFRSGHPKPWDILISTVGSLAEMKLYMGNKGCIAQNVVAFRATNISPLYLYQYLLYIRSDLVAYNIGSVQPSIKVTHIIKHPIYVPNKKVMKDFDDIAKPITEQLFASYNESENLKKLRSVLLPRLMSGELDVSKLDI